MDPLTIDKVTFELADLPAQPHYVWRDGLPAAEPASVGGRLFLHGSNGTVGSAPTARGAIVADIVDRRLAEELTGARAWSREWLWHRVWEVDRIEELPVYVLGLVDVALWDLAGKTLGLPVHDLLGSYRSRLPAYASTVTYGSVHEFCDVADQCLERGFKAIKLHAWGDARRDAQLVQALRAHVGDDVDLMYDGSAGFDLPDAIYVGHALADSGYRWYEEPMREFSVTAYRWLRERVSVPLLVGETSDGAHFNMGDFVAQGTADYLRTSAMYKGGVTGAMRIAHLADAYRLRAEVHGMGVVSRALCMAIPNTTYYEALVWGNPIATDPLVTADGCVEATQTPGFDWDEAATSW